MTHPPRIPLEARSPDYSLDELPRHWFAGDPVATHIVNAVSMLFPAGERFFVRSVHKFTSQLEDPELLARVRGFNKQEGHHARAHDEWNERLEAQGFEVKRFLRAYEALCFGFIERVSPAKLAVATTAASEQFTALLARDTIENDIFRHAAPELRMLMMWHAAEELEHKSVAFDVLRAVAPGWGWRAAGMALSATLLSSFWILGALLLIRQDKKLPAVERESLRGKLGEADVDKLPEIHIAMRERRRKIFGRVVLAGIADYLRPTFHPDEVDDTPLAQRGLATARLA